MNVKLSSIPKIIFMMLSLLLAACGGGGEISREGTIEPDPPTASVMAISLQIVDSDGQPQNELASGAPLTIVATVTQDGDPVNDELVTFSFSIDGLAEFGNDTGTALTGSDGVATIDILVGEDSGDGLVLANAGTAETASVGFKSSGSVIVGELPTSLEFFASSIQLASSGSDQVELIALVKNEQNILMEGIQVDFSANQDASLQIVNAVTQADGTARALLSTSNKALRTITATASTSNLTNTVDVEVVGTEINLNAPSSVIIDDSSPVTIIVADSDGTGIPNQTVQLSAQFGTLDNTSPSTNENGQVTVNYSSSVSGTDTIVASALNTETSIDIVVQEDDFSFSTLPTEDVELGENATIRIRWYKDGTPLVGGTVSLTASRGTLNTNAQQTDSNGVASFSISSTDAGVSSLSALGVDGGGNEVTARGSVEFIATDAQTIYVDASPDLIGPEGKKSTITAIVRDGSGNLVKGKLLEFRLDDISGGSIEPSTATTDSNGIASTVYTSNATSSEDAVIVHATVSDNPAVTNFTTLTVGERAFDLSIGTGKDINIPDSASYMKEIAVFVSDSVGQAVANVDLTVSSTPVKFSQGGGYYKGYWEWDPDLRVWYPVRTIFCPNEDIDANGFLDAGEDNNGDGELTPGIIGTVAFQDGDNSTDTNGQATIELRYPKQYAPWTDVLVSAFGNSSGSEATDSLQLTLPVAASDVNVEASPPPPNPFGVLPDCSTTD
ncbi:Ig-like domain-containing protein [Alteromonas facilis]|uniref:Ig-like domain-containing protein n=1 Tax=Alteromonas facilis TaxID=2048004 RepID=UPI000C285BC4|nr:Ig-like domain-containing protein [Alteromonas facilis]